MMTREDMLHELELLPVWTLRSQLQKTEAELMVVQTVSVVTESIISTEVLLQVELGQVDISLILDESLPPLVAESVSFESIEQLSDRQIYDTTEPIIKEFLHIISDDGDWLFVLSNKELQQDETILLRNILVAMRLKAKTVNERAMTDEVIATTLPKIIIAMGEATAQYLLQSSESLASLRGKLHTLQGVPLVSTYDLAHLLKTSSDKSKVWDDLCLAMQALQDLNLQVLKSGA